MLNTKYVIGQGEDGQIVPYQNPDANGNAWFVDEIMPSNSADETMRQLDSINTKRQAIVENNDRELFSSYRDLPNNFELDSITQISVTSYQPNYIKYQSSNNNTGFAVFSEIFYKHGWRAYIDGISVEHIPVNYVLRGLTVPAGEHTIEFKFEPQVVKTGSTISLSSSIILILLISGGLFWEFKKAT